ncbi:MAG: MCE family protein [Pseudonocardiaceae bacterium]
MLSIARFARTGGSVATVIAIGCVLGLLAATAVWSLTRGTGRTITGYFTSAVGVFPDNEVLILGVPVGRITTVAPQGRLVKVVMTIDDSVTVPANASAVVVSPSLITGRSIQLTPAYTKGPTMADGAVIPVGRTAVPLGVDDLARAVNDLATTLGPGGVNRNGALSDLLDVGASNLRGNGQALHDTIGNLAQLSGTLASSRKELFGTITQLQSLVSTLASNDAQVRQFTTQLADVSSFLAGERGDLAATLAQLSRALGEVAAFVQDNRAVLTSNVDRLIEVTAVLVRQRAALADILDTAPTALGNLNGAYDASSGTLDTRLILTALQAGQPPPLPLLALPTVPTLPRAAQ